jgi:tyrosyl-tRNA synthetase
MVIEEQVERLCRGIVEIFTKAELAERLAEAEKAGKPLRVKLGMDPTAPDIHLGHAVGLRKLRQFQELGHKVVLIVGDYTAMIGDPSGQNKTRPILSPEQIQANAETYFEQAGIILDTSPEKLEVRRNSEWLAKLSFADVIRLSSNMTVARMLERDTFELRLKDGAPIGMHEMLYPLMQGYDSVVVEADIEMGGTDQTFNNLVGRKMLSDAGQRPQIVMTWPLLVGLDGKEKMSKSKGNYVGLTESPKEMFGKLMSIPDELMKDYLTLLTDLPMEEIRTLADSDKTHPRDAKARLAGEIVTFYHGKEAAESASAEFQRIFSEKQLPKEMPVVHLADKRHRLMDIVKQSGLASSSGQAKRLIQQGGVRLSGKRLTDPSSEIEISAGDVLQVGKRHFVRLIPVT